MNILSAFLVALGLSMDNLAVALAAGCNGRGHLPHRIILQISGLFALAHFVMFSVGFWGGHELVRWIGMAGGWAACAILVYIGMHMIIESARPAEKTMQPGILISLRVRCLLAFATSIDALFVGMGLGLTQTDYVSTVVLVTLCVFLTSIGGFYAGRLLGRRFGSFMEKLGGVVLIGIGVKLLLDRLGIW